MEPGQLLIYTDEILLAEPPPTAAAVAMMPDPEGWTWCRNRDNEAGWVPDTYLLVLSPPEVHEQWRRRRRKIGQSIDFLVSLHGKKTHSQCIALS